MKQGTLEVLTGPMFSSKTESLIKLLERAQKYAKIPTIAFKPTIDTRSDSTLASHAKKQWPAINIDTNNPLSILELVTPEHMVVGIEEVQFFNADIIAVVCQLVGAGKRVILAGLDLDARGKPFGHMPELLALADKVVKLTAICDLCGQEANRTHRISDSKSLVEIGASDKYAPRCKDHFEPF